MYSAVQIKNPSSWHFKYCMSIRVHYILKYTAADSVSFLFSFLFWEICSNCHINTPWQCFKRLSDEKSHKNLIMNENESSNLMFCMLISHSCLTSCVSVILLKLRGLIQYPKVKTAMRFGCPGLQCTRLWTRKWLCNDSRALTSSGRACVQPLYFP